MGFLKFKINTFTLYILKNKINLPDIYWLQLTKFRLFTLQPLDFIILSHISSSRK